MQWKTATLIHLSTGPVQRQQHQTGPEDKKLYAYRQFIIEKKWLREDLEIIFFQPTRPL
jgi:hypothetical protein